MKHLTSYARMLAESHSEPHSKLDDDLIKAVKNGSTKRVKELLKAGASPDAKTQDNFRLTALHLALKKPSIEMTRTLLDAGANPNVPDSTGWYPIHACIHTAGPKHLELLLQYNADVDRKTEDNIQDTALHRVMYTSGKSALEKLRLLLDANANPYKINVGGDSIFTKCVHSGNVGLLKEVLQRINVPQDEMKNLMHHAAVSSSPEMIDFVLGLGAEIDEENEEGLTPLALLKRNDQYGGGWLTGAKARLIELGADPIKAGYTAEEMVSDMEKWLKEIKGEKGTDSFFAKYLPPGPLKEMYRRNTKATNLFGI